MQSASHWLRRLPIPINNKKYPCTCIRSSSMTAVSFTLFQNVSSGLQSRVTASQPQQQHGSGTISFVPVAHPSLCLNSSSDLQSQRWFGKSEPACPPEQHTTLMPEVQPRVQHLLAGVAGLSISPKHTVAIFFDSKHRCGRLICQWLIIAVWKPWLLLIKYTFGAAQGFLFSVCDCSHCVFSKHIRPKSFLKTHIQQTKTKQTYTTNKQKVTLRNTYSTHTANDN